MHHLPVDHGHVAGGAHQRDGAGQLLTAAVLPHHGLDVRLAELVGAGDDPETVADGGGIELDLKVEAVNALIPVRVVPMRDPVLMPGDGAAEAGLLHEDRIVERHEIGAIDRLCRRQQLRMPIQAQPGRHGLAHRVHQEHHMLGRVGVRLRLGHLRRMPPSEDRRATPGVGQRPGETVRHAGVVQAQRRTSLRVDGRVRPDRRAGEHGLCVGAQGGDLGLIDDAGEDVVAVAPIGGLDVGMQRAVIRQPEGAAIADFLGQALPRFTIGRHARIVFGAGDALRGGHGLGHVIHRAFPLMDFRHRRRQGRDHASAPPSTCPLSNPAGGAMSGPQGSARLIESRRPG